MVVGIWISLVTSTTTVAPLGAWISGPGYWPLYPYMTISRPSIVRRTRETAMCRVSPSDIGTSSEGRATGNIVGAMPMPGRKGSTTGTAPSRPGSIGMFGSIGGMRQPSDMVIPPWPA